MIAADKLTFLSRAAEVACEGSEPAHDFSHVLRVMRNAKQIAIAQGADDDIAQVAALLHELFNYPKNHPNASQSGQEAAARAGVLLREIGMEEPFVQACEYAIRVHPFSLGVVPETLEARVLQDADRLDAIGAVGIARCFATCGSMGRPLFSPVDPCCEQRQPDDKAWGLDHFYRKLLRIPDTLHTDAARKIAAGRVEVMKAYLVALGGEIG